MPDFWQRLWSSMAPITRSQVAKPSVLVPQHNSNTITRSQAAKAKSSVLAPQSDGNRVRKTKSPSPVVVATNLERIRATVIERDTDSEANGSLCALRESVLKRELKGAVEHLYLTVCKTRIDRGLTKVQLLTRIKKVCREQCYGNLNLQRRTRRVQDALKLAAIKTNSHHTTMSSEEIIESLMHQLYEEMRKTHLAPNGNQPNSRETQVQVIIPCMTSASSVASATTNRPPTKVEEKAIKGDPELMLDERERVAKLAFSPKIGRDVSVEFALLEILSTLGRDSLEDLIYDDFVRLVQIVKQDNLARIKVEIEWDPTEAP